MSRNRRLLIGSGLSVAVLATAAAGAWAWWLPSRVERALQQAAARRGLEAQLGSIEGGFSALELHGVSLRRGDALSVEAGRIQTGVDVFTLALEGSGAVRHVAVDDLSVQLDAEADLVALLEALQGESTSPEGASGARGDRALSVRGISMRVHDGRGTLVRTRGASAQLTGDSLSVTSSATRIAPDASDGVDLGPLTVRLRRGEGWTVRRVALGTTRVRYAEHPAGQRSPLWGRLNRLAQQVAAIAGDAAEAPETTESETTDSPATTDATQTTDVDGEPGGPTDRGAPTAERWAGAVEAMERLEPYLEAGSTFEISDLSVEMNEGERSSTILGSLEAELVVLDGERYRFEGSGRPGRGGRLGWNVVLEPERLRAEGRVDFQRAPFVLILPMLPDLPWHQPEQTRLTGQLSVEGEGVHEVHLSGRVRVEGLALHADRIAPTPVRRIGFEVEGAADFTPIDRRLTVSRVEVRSGDAAVQASGTFEWPEDHYLLDVRATLPPTPCNAAVGAIPSDLLGELTTMTLSGQIGGRVRTHVDSRDLDATTLDIDVADGCRFETVPPLADVTRFQGPFRHRVLEPDGSTFEMESGPESANWVPLSSISPFFVQAVLGHEDGGFFRHSGFATHAIRTALVRNLTAGRFVYGASTITMQLVKNVFLHREKTLARKVQEVLLTWWIENAMSKAEILELYLNVIEYGPDVYGIRHAADHYFGRPAGELGPAESAYLATILPNPAEFHAHWEDDELPSRHRRRVERFLRTLRSRGRFDARALEYGLARIAELDFHHPGETLPLPHDNPGTVRPLPIDPALFQGAWDAAFGGPDDGGDAEPGGVIDPWEDADGV